MRRHGRVRCFSFRLRQFASASSSARASAFLGRGMDFTGHTGFTDDPLTGTAAIVIGTELWRPNCQPLPYGKRELSLHNTNVVRRPQGDGYSCSRGR